MWEHPQDLLSSCFLPHFPQTFLPAHVQHVHLTICFCIFHPVWDMISPSLWHMAQQLYLLASSFLWSLRSLCFIQNTPGILPFCNPSTCQSCHSYSLCTCPSLSLEYSFPALCTNALFCRHSDLPSPPKLKCLFCFLHGIHYLLKLPYSFVLMLIFEHIPYPPIRKWALGGGPCPSTTDLSVNHGHAQCELHELIC